MVSNKAKRTDDWESYTMVFTNYNKEIGRWKPIKKGLLPAVKDVADKIMGRQPTRWDVLNYLMADIHWRNFTGLIFQDLREGWWPMVGQGMLNLGAYLVNREDWEVSEESKIWWVKNTFNSF